MLDFWDADFNSAYYRISSCIFFLCTYPNTVSFSVHFTYVHTFIKKDIRHAYIHRVLDNWLAPPGKNLSIRIKPLKWFKNFCLSSIVIENIRVLISWKILECRRRLCLAVLVSCFFPSMMVYWWTWSGTPSTW